MQKLMLAGNDPALLAQLYERLNEDYLVHVCRGGPNVVEDFLIFLPDILIVDLEIPGCDCISLLHAVQARAGQTKVLATAYSYHSHVTEPLSLVGTAFLLIQPFSVEDLLARLEQLQQLFSGDNDRLLPVRIDEILQQLGMDCRSVGFTCLREAILYKYYNPDCLFNDDLCTHVAKICVRSPQAVRKAIGRCIRKAWQQRSPALWSCYFPDNGGTLTNVVFIKTIAAYLK